MNPKIAISGNNFFIGNPILVIIKSNPFFVSFNTYNDNTNRNYINLNCSRIKEKEMSRKDPSLSSYPVYIITYNSCGTINLQKGLNLI